jgi:hypothetical protein
MADVRQETRGFTHDLTDGRNPGEWKSAYPRPARIAMWFEAVYLGVLFLAFLWLWFAVWMHWPGAWFHLDDAGFARLQEFLLPLASGSLGGTCFVTKWFYHAIPGRSWHQDRLFWRLFAPWVSGALALAIVLLLPSGLFTLLKGATFSTPAVTGALGFIAGYFSDATLGKLAQIAHKLFGTKQAPAA